MYTYRVIFGRSSVPELGDLRASSEGQPNICGDVFRMVFATGPEIARPPYDDAVGGLCRVLRLDEHGNIEEATGSVRTNSPLTVSLDGKGWSPCAYVYLRFGEIPASQRRAVLTRLQSMLTADMTFSEQSGKPVVRVETPERRCRARRDKREAEWDSHRAKPRRRAGHLRLGPLHLTPGPRLTNSIVRLGACR